MSAPDAKFGELSHRQVMNIADQIAQCGIREVSLTGGKPPVRKDFMDIVDRLTDGGVHLRTRRHVMYISAEGRCLPCMALSGMDIQYKFPLITETELCDCLSDSFYMNFLETRASEMLEHNPSCKKCEYALNCLGGCRASGLETSPDNLFAPDMAACRFFRDRWGDKIDRLMKGIV